MPASSAAYVASVPSSRRGGWSGRGALALPTFIVYREHAVVEQLGVIRIDDKAENINVTRSRCQCRTNRRHYAIRQKGANLRGSFKAQGKPIGSEFAWLHLQCPPEYADALDMGERANRHRGMWFDDHLPKSERSRLRGVFNVPAQRAVVSCGARPTYK